MRIGLGLASVALVALSACGGGGSDGASEPEATGSSPSLDLLSASQACVQAEMINEGLGGEPGSWTIPTYGRYGGEIALLARESVPEIADVLQPVGEHALIVGGMSGDDDVTEAAGIWATHYQALVDVCARTDSPITRLSN